MDKLQTLRMKNLELLENAVAEVLIVDDQLFNIDALKFLLSHNR